MKNIIRNLTGQAPPAEAPASAHEPSRTLETMPVQEPASHNPFSSDNSDSNSLGSDQYLSDFRPGGPSHPAYDAAANRDAQPASHDITYPSQDSYLPRESAPTSSSGPITYPSTNYPTRSVPYGSIQTPRGMSTAAAAAGSAAAVSGAATLLGPPTSHPSSASLAALSAGEYDRYPSRISSTAPSVMSVPLRRGQQGDNSYSPVNGSTVRDSGSSSKESGDSVYSGKSATPKPFLTNSDFSPFGGYPASAFPLHIDEKEADDYIHNPDPILDAQYDRKCQKLDRKGWQFLAALMCLILGGIALFIIYPVLTYTGLTDADTNRNVTVQTIELLSPYEYNTLSAIRTSLIDSDTPSDVRSFSAYDGSKWNLVFSDEFNKEGRTFYEGDDQFWTAPDIHYAATTDLEWYDPDAVHTENGTLVLTLDAFKNHNLFYRSGMVQSWNKFCFTQGYIEVAAQLPGNGSILGLWPGIWTLGNLGRPGYLGTTEGVWPYGYSECDAGITPNQSSTDGISYLKGQKLNACTCPGADHPNPGVGRGAPEIDVLEGTVSSDLKTGVASQSLQLAPYDIWYMPDMNFIEIYNQSVTVTNTWFGGPLQQAISMASTLNTAWYEYPTHEGETPSFQSFGFEYMNDDTEGYIRWFIGGTATHTIFAPTLGPNGNVGQRQISKEPMSIIMNLGISNSWVYIDWPSLTWPSHMRIDYIRVYQPGRGGSLTCDPSDYPTYDYIQNHLDVYMNANITSWENTTYEWPKNRLTGC